MPRFGIETLIASLTLLCTCVNTVATVVIAIYAVQQVKKASEHLKRANDLGLVDLSGRHNWSILENKAEMPDAVATPDLSWRVIHLEHLNLLWFVFRTYRQEVPKDGELHFWTIKARSWFRPYWSDSADSHEGREVLRQLLRPEEGYPDDYRKWLVDNRIVSPDIVSD